MLDALKCMGAMGMPIESILHIGANEGQERFDYEQNGASPCIYVEPVEAVFRTLEANAAGMRGHLAVKAVCSETTDEQVSFNVASNGGQSSSLLALGPHADFHPSIVYTHSEPMVTTTVDRVIAQFSPRRVPNLLVVDTQGADLRVLRGAANSLPSIDGVFVEVSETPLYEGGCTHKEITAFLEKFGFRLRWMVLDHQGHGEAFYLGSRPKVTWLPSYGGNMARGKPAAQSSLCEWSHFHFAQGPGGGVNGQITGHFGFHTAVEEQAWWQVDLEAVQDLNEIRVYNRMDSGRERSRTLQILVSSNGSNWTCVHDQAGYTFGGADARPLRVMVSGTSARFVRLQLAERSPLHLDEVEVY